MTIGWLIVWALFSGERVLTDANGLNWWTLALVLCLLVDYSNWRSNRS